MLTLLHSYEFSAHPNTSTFDRLQGFGIILAAPQECSASSGYAYGFVSYVCALSELPYPILALLRIFSVTSIGC